MNQITKTNEVKITQDILKELGNTANLLANSANGEREKTLEVTFQHSSSPNAITIDMSKFITDEGKINYDEKSIVEEKGRLLTRQELLRQTTSMERQVLAGFSVANSNLATKEVKTIFNGVVSKNSIDSVKEKWTGFSDEVEAFRDSLARDTFVNKASSYLEKTKAIMEKWGSPKSHIDFSDSGIDKHWDEFQSILDFVQDEFRKPFSGTERLEISNRIFEEIKKRLEEIEKELPPKGNPKDEPEGESEGEPEGEPEGESEGEPEGEPEDKPEGKPEGKPKRKPKGKPEFELEGDPEGESEGESEDESEDESEGEPEDETEPTGKPKTDDLMERIMSIPENTERPDLVNVKPDEVKPEGSEVKSEPWDNAKAVYCIWKNKVEHNDKLAHRDFLTKFRRTIETIKQSFAFKQVELARPVFGKSLGDLDSNGLHKFHMGEKIRLFEEKQVPKGKKYTIGILLDQSGSMSGNKIEEARQVTLAIVEALKQIKGIDLCVWGHTADQGKLGETVGKRCEIDMIPYYQKGMDYSAKLATANAIHNNGDGFAVRFIAERMLELNPSNPNSIHHLFVVSDGEPAASCYRGDNGVEHTRNCVEQARKLGVDVFGIGICNAFPNSVGQRLYGKDNFVVLKDTVSSLPLLCREIKKLITK